MLLDALDDWFELMDQATGPTRGSAAAPVQQSRGWPQVEAVVRTAFRFFVERPDFVRLARWEALEGGTVLVEELATVLRPLFERGAAFLEGEMDAGRLRRCDARRLVITGYGAVLSYLSDAPWSDRSWARTHSTRSPSPPSRSTCSTSSATPSSRGTSTTYLSVGRLTHEPRGAPHP